MRVAKISVQEHGNRENRQMILSLEITSGTIKTPEDLKEAVIKACTDFVCTPTGKRIYDYNCGCFNWADFEEEMPDYFCMKYGFKKLHDPDVEMNFDVDWDEHLVDDMELESEEEDED